MLKVFDTDLCEIRKAKSPKIRTIEINADILNIPVREMNNKIVEAVKMNIAGGDLYIKVDIVGKCSTEDIEDLYDYVESAITSAYCTNNIIKKNNDRLGTFGLPKVNMKNINLLKWVKYESPVCGIGFEVGKKGSFWKKRMVK